MRRLHTVSLALLVSLFSLTSPPLAQAQVRNGLYGGTAPGGPAPPPPAENIDTQYGFFNKRNRKLNAINFLTYTNCSYESGRQQNFIAQLTNSAEANGPLSIKMNANNTFRKAFSWVSSDGTQRTSVISGRPSGPNAMRVRVNAFAVYDFPTDPDVDMTCSGTSVYRMRYMPSPQTRSYIGFTGNNSVGFDLRGSSISNVYIVVHGECSEQGGGSYPRTFIARTIDVDNFIFTGATTINQEIAAEAGAFMLDAQFTRTSTREITVDITASSNNGGTTCLGNATIVAATNS